MKEVKASEIIQLIEAGKPVQMVNKVILGDLDLSAGSEPYMVNANMLQSEIKSNLFFGNCVFKGKVTANGTKETLPVHSCFKNNVTFVDCDFKGEVDFSESVIFGMLNLSKSVFRGNANFTNLMVWAKDSYLSELQAEKDFLMIYASFAGNLYCTDARFDGSTSFQEMSVRGKLSFNNTVFSQKAGFDLMETGGNAFFNYAVFEKGATFSFSRFLHTAEFLHTDFKEKGEFEKTFFLNAPRCDNPEMTTELQYNDNKPRP